MADLDHLLAFVDFTQKLQQIKRRLPIKGEERFENVLEHSGQLALVAWFLIMRNNLPLDSRKAIQYALFHDLIEVYAGDTPAFDSSPEYKASQKEREQMAINRLRETYPEFIDSIEGYESQTDQESKFIYALDKFLPVMGNFLDQGRSWKMFNVTLEQLLEEKTNKISVSEDVKRYFDQLVTTIQQHEKEYFG